MQTGWHATTMTSNYEAWNGELYEWPPPDGWYLATDGRWWAPDTGPGPAELPAAIGAEVEAKTRLMHQPDADAITTVDTASSTVPPPMHRTGPNPVVEPADPWAYAPVAARRDDPAQDFETDGISETWSERTTPLLATNTGPVSVVTEEEHRRRLRPFGLHPAVLVAGLLVLAAVGVAVVLAAAGGKDGELATNDDPTVVDGETVDDSESAAGTDGDDQTEDTVPLVGENLSGAGSMDDSASDSMDDSTESASGSAADSASAEDDTDTSDDQTTTTVDLTASLEAVTEFRTTLDELGITSDALSAEDIVTFGQSACGYAAGADELDGYVEARDEALAEAENEELTIEELSTVVDVAVQVFCPEQATRLGL